MKQSRLSVLLIAGISISGFAFAAVPHQLQSGSPARASDVNANFSNLDDRVVANQAKLDQVLSRGPMQWKGTWTTGVAYHAMDLAQFDGSVFVCIADTTGVEPTSDTAFWALFASRGGVGPIGLQGLVGPTGAQGPQAVMGASGPQGLQGPQGVAGPQGAVGARGATGTAGAEGPEGPVGPTSADFRQPYEFVGASYAVVAGNAGIGAMKQACQAKFGPTARMTLMSEVLDSTVSQDLGGGWIQPEGGAQDIAENSQSGSCNAWSSDVMNYGMAVGNDLKFVLGSCAVSRTVACSTPKLTNPSYRFAGYSSTFVLGSGFRDMNAVCQLDFGPGARMASTEEVFRTAPTPAVDDTAWVKPSVTKNFTFTSNDHTCASVQNGGPYGTVLVGPGLQLFGAPCNQAHPAACSVPN